MAWRRAGRGPRCQAGSASRGSPNGSHRAVATSPSARLAAAIGYYRAYADNAEGQPYAAETAARFEQAPQPTLYMHGAQDGCFGLDVVRDTGRYLAPGSRMEVVDDVGHFLHLERPELVNERIVAWVTGKLSGPATSE